MPSSSAGDQACHRWQAGLVRASIVQREPELLGFEDDDGHPQRTGESVTF